MSIAATLRADAWLSAAQRHAFRRRTATLELAEALRVITAATRSGHSLAHAFERAGERTGGTVSAAFRRAASELHIGMSVERAVNGVAAEVNDPSARLLAQVLAVQHRRGGDLGSVCYRLARLLHERGRLAHEAHSVTAQARFTARAVLAMPVTIGLGWAWLAPASFRELLTPGMLLTMSPSLLLLVVGILVVRRCAAVPHVGDAANIAPRDNAGSLLHRLLGRVAGNGPITHQTGRCVAAASIVGLLPAVGGTTNRFFVVSALAGVALAGAWPTLRLKQEQQRLETTVAAGLPTLLELTIALLAAGATAHDAIVGSIEGSPMVLRSRLEPALAQIRLGRSAASALAALPAVQQVPELDLWAQALAMGDRLGTPVTDVLETLLRDARSTERERFRQRAAVAGPRMQLAIVLLIVPAIMWVVLVTTAHGMLEQLQATGVLGG